MNIKKLIELTNNALENVRKPVKALAGFLVYATAVQRPGLSKIKISSEII